MRLFLNGATTEVKRLLTEYPIFSHYLGILHIPRAMYFQYPQLPMAADNLAFSKFHSEYYRTMLARISYYPIEWVTAPDCVGNAAKTLDLFYTWKQVIEAYKLPVALVAQDGIENTEIPWQDFRCLFIGGTTGFKYSKSVIDVMCEAKKQGKLVHIGRVNTVERILHFAQYDPDSFDGSSYAKFPSKICSAIAALVELRGKKWRLQSPSRT